MGMFLAAGYGEGQDDHQRTPTFSPPFRRDGRPSSIEVRPPRIHLTNCWATLTDKPLDINRFPITRLRESLTEPKTDAKPRTNILTSDRTNTGASTAGSPAIPAANLASTAGNATKAASPAPSTSNRPQSTARVQPASNQPANNGRQKPPSTAGRAPSMLLSGTSGPTHTGISNATLQPEKTAADKGSAKDPTGSKSGLGAARTGVNNGETRPGTSLDTKFGDEGPGFYNGANMANAESIKASDVAPSRARTSKTSTPVVSNTAEPQQQQRSRPLRSTEGGGATKRSHKKGASTSTAARQPAAPVPVIEAEDILRPGDDEDDEGEPRYCYCNQVSFGEMVACDNDYCPREWFHLSCVGLTKPPLKSGELSFNMHICFCPYGC